MVHESTVYELTAELCAILKADYYKRRDPLDYDFTFEAGRKYYKVIMVNNQQSVHAFVDKKTGDLYKAAGWNAPAKGVRFNLLTDMEMLKSIADWSGSYLYAR